MAAEPDREGDIGDRVIRFGKHCCGAVQPNPPLIPMRALADQSGKDPLGPARRQVHQSAQLPQR